MASAGGAIIAPLSADGVKQKCERGCAALTKARAARKMIFVFASIGPTNAQVAELADALDSGSSAGNGVEVRILSWAPTTYELRDSPPSKLD
jgi:hypothetical protein